MYLNNMWQKMYSTDCDETREGIEKFIFIAMREPFNILS